MPAGDRNGPLGQGPMTGRRMGFCSGLNFGDFGGRFAGRGFGRGRGMGFRRASMPVQQDYPIQTSNENEAEILRMQAQELKATLTSIEERLGQLEKNSSKKDVK